ncbi:DMT family transporter [Myxococcus sp. AM011]|uniref:DMT family transporter n=1 Tax=Myxococcus sp. AM011 TaxID=2745200 RepID=UPI001595FE8E|nr:DMT family transporter [Myxococcus sp. AM011]NVJ27446.1 DMT family transporter [Myxococcus sp. AM011]
MWIAYGLGAGVMLGLYDVWTKKAMTGNSVIPVVMWSSLFGALCWVPVLIPGALPIRVEPFGLTWQEQAWLLPKGVAMTASWILAYYAVRELPISIAGAVRASGPLWTLAGGFLMFRELLTPVQFLGLMLTVCSYYVLSIVGRKEGLVLSKNSSVWWMLSATALSAATTVYDKFLVSRLGLPVLELQASSAFQRCILSALVFVPYMLRRGGLGLGLTWSWGIPLVGCSWVAAELIYFVAITEPQAMVTHLSVLRRTSLIVGFVLSALFFREANVLLKSGMIAVLILGMAILILGG